MTFWTNTFLSKKLFLTNSFICLFPITFDTITSLRYREDNPITIDGSHIRSSKYIAIFLKYFNKNRNMRLKKSIAKTCSVFMMLLCSRWLWFSLNSSAFCATLGPTTIYCISPSSSLSCDISIICCFVHVTCHVSS